MVCFALIGMMVLSSNVVVEAGAGGALDLCKTPNPPPGCKIARKPVNTYNRGCFSGHRCRDRESVSTQ